MVLPCTLTISLWWHDIKYIRQEWGGWLCLPNYMVCDTLSPVHTQESNSITYCSTMESLAQKYYNAHIHCKNHVFWETTLYDICSCCCYLIICLWLAVYWCVLLISSPWLLIWKWVFMLYMCIAGIVVGACIIILLILLVALIYSLLLISVMWFWYILLSSLLISNVVVIVIIVLYSWPLHLPSWSS